MFLLFRGMTMYFPYLYARQGECRAIEDMAGRLGEPQTVFPVLEPVVANAKDLTRALDSLQAENNVAYVIVNPSRYKFLEQGAFASWSNALAPYLNNPRLVRPTLEIRPGVSLSDLSSFVTAYPGRQLGVSIRSSQIAAVDISHLTGPRAVVHFLHSAADPAGYTVGIGASRTVEVRDSFRTEARNADYSGFEPFTSANLHFKKEGRSGFSDYALLPGHFNPNGGPLGAAVVHMTFVDSHDRSFWVHHFVSDETRQYQGTQPSKLMEAMTKLDAVVQADPSKFALTPGLSSYAAQFSARRPTSPTYNKRQQISHHIDTVAGTL